MIYKNELIRIRDVMNERVKDFNKELRTLPEGRLVAVRRNGKYQYYQHLSATGNRKKERRYGITSNPDMILGLVRKRYILSALSSLKKDISMMDNLLLKYEATDEESVMKKFSDRYPQLVDGIHYGKITRESWENEFVPQKGFYEEDLTSISLKGVPMRSEGEIYIASRLDHYGIPYRYEEKLKVPDLGEVPDFTILRPRDNKIFYWEHFGKTHDDKYVRDNMEKVYRYIEYGIAPWDNLIMTYNYKEGGFNAKHIDAMIEAYLL